MTKYLSEYIEIVNEKVKGKVTNKDILELKDKISFFSHERLIHLIVTFFFALFTIIFVYFGINGERLLFLLIALVLMIILIFYVFHYFFLENSVQYLYKIYDEMNKKLK